MHALDVRTFGKGLFAYLRDAEGVPLISYRFGDDDVTGIDMASGRCLHDGGPPFLDGEYAAFGKIIEGMDVADAIVKAPRDMNDKPKQAQRMAKVTLEED